MTLVKTLGSAAVPAFACLAAEAKAPVETTPASKTGSHPADLGYDLRMKALADAGILRNGRIGPCGCLPRT